MSTNYSPHIVTNGLVLLLDAANPKSYPGTGTTWYDLSGNGNHATNYGATWNSNGYFSFSSNYMDLPNDIGYTDSVSIFSIFRVSAGTTPGSYHIIMGGEEMEISVNQDSTYLRNGISTNIERYVQNDGNIITDSIWHYAGFTHSNNVKKSYINGQYINQQTTSGTVTNTFTRRLGRFGSSSVYYLTGDISIVVCYNHALTQSEITQNYNALRSRFGI